MIREMRDRAAGGGSTTKAPAAPEVARDLRPMAFAYRELLDFRILGLALTTVGLIVGIMSFIGPLGSYDRLSLLQRFVYGFACAAFGWPVCHCVTVVTFYLMRDRTPTMGALAASLAMLFAAVPCTSVASAFKTLLFGDYAVFDGFLTLYLLVASLAVACCLLFHYIVCQRLKLSAGSAVMAGMGGAPGGAEGGDGTPGPVPERPGAADAGGTPAVEQRPAEGEARARFIGRMPAEIGHELVYIKTEDHYVEVHTTVGSARVLVRFADAVDELGEFGMQVHRCYWVAHGQMAELLTRGHRTLLRLADDSEVPVSRRYLADVQAVLGIEQAAVAG